MSLEALAHEATGESAKLVHLALPLRLTLLGKAERSTPEMVCTYDIHPRGARLLSGRSVNLGDLLQLERGRNKAVCRVIWIADANSPLRGQFTVECVDQGKAPWEDELRQGQEQFFPLLTAEELRNGPLLRRGDANKRRRPRFTVDGAADLIHLDGPMLRTEGQIKQLSELGCLIHAAGNIMPGAYLKVALNVFKVSVALRGQVKYSGEKTGLGVEFTEIRQGDRPLLAYVLAALSSEKRAPEIKPAALAAGL